jgi:hypothetical protein
MVEYEVAVLLELFRLAGHIDSFDGPNLTIRI